MRGEQRGGCSPSRTMDRAPPHRRPRPRSPPPFPYHSDDYDFHSHQRQRQRHGDAGADEMIRMVRGYQLERESTFMRLQRKAPLPGIGQVSHSFPEASFSSQGVERRLSSHTYQDFEEEEEDDDDDVLDSEVAAIEEAQRDPLRLVNDRMPHPTDRPAPGIRPPPNLNATHHTPSHQRQHVRPLDVYAGGRAAGKGRNSLGRPLKQLPPITRDELPERPSAPSPSLTPPGEGEELDSAGEPVDFIDAA